MFGNAGKIKLFFNPYRFLILFYFTMRTALLIDLRFQFFFSLQINCVIVPIGQKAHHERGLKKNITIKPISKDVNIRL